MAMHDRWLKLYPRLPSQLWSFAASLHGWRLRAWRYGRETEQLVKEARAREQWNLSQWEAWRAKRLAYILHRAVSQVPYYREYWRQRRLLGDGSPWEKVENWPILEKEKVRESPLSFLADDCDTNRMFSEHTSGTTGTPLSLWWSRDTVRKWYALFEARWRRWYGVSRRDRWGILGGQLVVPVERARPPFWVWNAPMKQLYLSSYHLKPAWIPSYLDALSRYKVTYLYGYPSALAVLAKGALEQERSDIRLSVVVSDAEPLYDFQRQAIRAAFHCPVRETYGMAEIAGAAGECENGQLHFWPEVGHTEVMDPSGMIKQSGAGELIMTGLLNGDMPLIRYRVGDRGSLADESHVCSCGRTLPVLLSLEGRADDSILTPDGRVIGRLDPVFKEDLPIREAQIIQESQMALRIRLVPGEGYTEGTGKNMVHRLQDRLGQMKVTVEVVSQIPRDANGKFRSVISRLSKR